MKIAISLAALAAALVATPVMAQAAPAAAPTAAEAEAFLTKAEKALFDQSIISGRAAWINATYITDDTDAIASYFGAIDTKQRVDFALEAGKYATAPGLSAETRRRLNLLQTALTLPAPTTAGAAEELNELATKLQSAYGKGMCLTSEGTIQMLAYDVYEDCKKAAEKDDSLYLELNL